MPYEKNILKIWANDDIKKELLQNEIFLSEVPKGSIIKYVQRTFWFITVSIFTSSRPKLYLQMEFFGCTINVYAPPNGWSNLLYFNKATIRIYLSQKDGTLVSANRNLINLILKLLDTESTFTCYYLKFLKNLLSQILLLVSSS